MAPRANWKGFLRLSLVGGAGCKRGAQIWADVTDAVPMRTLAAVD